MEINELYNTARIYIDRIKKEKPFYFFEHDSSLCLIKTNTQIFCGTTCIKINNGKIETVSSDYNAVLLFIANSKEKAEQMLVVMADDYRLTVPFSESIQMLLKAGSCNGKCQIIMSESQSISAENFCADSSRHDNEFDFFSGFDDSPIDASPYNDNNFMQNQNVIHQQQSNRYSQQESSNNQSYYHTGSNNVNYVSGNSPQESQYFSQYIGSNGSAFKRKLSRFLEEDDETDKQDNNSSDDVSKEELLRQAKKNKKAAKRGMKF